MKIELSNDDWGQIVSLGQPNISADSALEIDVNGYLTNGTFTIIDSLDSGSIGDLTIQWDSPLFSITRVVDDQNLIIRVLMSHSYEEMGLNRNAAAVGRTLDGVVSTAEGDMQTVIGALDDLETQQEISDAMGTMEPSVDGSIVGMGNAMVKQIINTISNHFITKNETICDFLPRKHSFWFNMFGTFLNQDERQEIKGYRSDTIGGALGFDFISSDINVFGLGASYAHSKVRPKLVNLNETKVDSMQGLVYYNYNSSPNCPLNKGVYLNFIGSVGYNMYKGSRNILIGDDVNRLAKADYDGQQYAAYGETGYYLPVSKINLIPMFSLEYLYLNISNYTETGADSINLKVDRQHYNILETGLGLRMSSVIKRNDCFVIPELRIKWLYDCKIDEANTYGGIAFETIGAIPAKSTLDLGATLTLIDQKRLKIYFDYDFNVKSDYYSHNGSITFKY